MHIRAFCPAREGCPDCPLLRFCILQVITDILGRGPETVPVSLFFQFFLEPEPVQRVPVIEIRLGDLYQDGAVGVLSVPGRVAHAVDRKLALCR